MRTSYLFYSICVIPNIIESFLQGPQSYIISMRTSYFCKFPAAYRPSVVRHPSSIPKIRQFHEKPLFCVNEYTPFIIENKIDGILNITRIKDTFIPASTLIFLCGYIANPLGIFNWIKSPIFWGSFSTVHLITSASMVLNDIFDMKIDRINNPNRPLINGSLEIEEAIGIALLMLMIVVYIGNVALPHFLSPYWVSSMFLIILYTPLFKRLFLLKNLTCATVISLTVPFIGLSVLDARPTHFINWSQMLLTVKMLFMTSMYTELLLDITDVKGDQINGINTLPVVIGKQNTMGMVIGIVLMNWINTIMGSSMNPIKIMGMNLVYFPYFINIWRILRTNFSKNVIKNSVKQTNISLFLYFIIQVICGKVI
jgi:geranylgeranylglycerol-phosphate geranylgeranyltransferase